MRAPNAINSVREGLKPSSPNPLRKNKKNATAKALMVVPTIANSWMI